MRNIKIISLLLAVMILVSSLPFAGLTTLAEPVDGAENTTEASPDYTEVPEPTPQLEPPVISSVSGVATGIKISWGKVNGAVKYRVFYKANGESSWHKAGETTSASFTWTKAKSNTKYTFAVRCIDKDGTNYTSVSSASKTISKYIAAPKISSVSGVATGIQIKWGKVAGAAKYRIFYKANGESNWHKAGETTSTSYTWTKAKSNTKYTFAVRCIDKDGKNYTSVSSAATTMNKYIAAPKISSVSGVATGIQIKWGKVAGAAKYRIFYKANGESSWHKAGETTSASFTWTKAKSNTKYTFAVRCIDKDGKNYTSASSASKTISKYIAAPQILGVINVSTGTLISWKKVPGAAKYRVFYKANGESTWHKVGDTTSTNITWKKAKSGTKYTFTVRCITSDGKSYTSSSDGKGKSPSSTFTTSKGYKGVVKNGVVYIDGYLIANKTYPLPKGYGNGLTSELNKAFKEMAAGAKKDGLNIYISSGYRSYSLQDSLYTRYSKADGVKKADTYSARPGHSEHQSGLAFDVNIISDAFIGTPEAIWLAKNCYKYGFILRYPKGKTNETGYKYEPWHFRYVGKDLAKKLYNGGDWLTMEDYFGFTSEYC